MDDGYERLRAVPLREQVYDSLASLILDGRLRAGERLVEADLAAKLGVSRGPIREALQSLERDGWIEVRPRSGTYVREPKEDELRDYFGIRTVLELQAAARAATMVHTHPTEHAAHVGRLRSLLTTASDLTAGLPASDVTDLTPDQVVRRDSYRQASRSFHHTIAEMAGSRALVDVLEYMWKRTRWYSSFSYVDRIDEHARIAEAVSAGDAAAAEALMREHMENMSNVSAQTLRHSVQSRTVV